MRKRNSIIYPEHKCLSCERLHTNKNYCDIHQTMYTIGAKNPVPSSKDYITAVIEINPRVRRLENKNTMR